MRPSNLPESIYFGDIQHQFKSWLSRQTYSSYFMLVDSSSSVYCLPDLIAVQPDIQWHIIEIPRGEDFKTITTCSIIWEELFKHGADRHSLLVNLGGGVIGDMGGFAAGTYMRGIDFVQIPTTLLAMVDASIGGKVAVDFRLAKNIIGLFQNPVANFIDARWLSTLSGEDKKSGWAEMLKHALIADADAFRQMQSINSLAEIDWDKWIRHSIQIKYNIVKNDPKEKGLRKGLNLGHTIGHALETYLLTQKTPQKHGACVAVGMVCAAYISNMMEGLSQTELTDIVQAIKKWYDYIPIPRDAYDQILINMTKDKKNRSGQLNFTLIPQIGQSVYNRNPPVEFIIGSLDFYNDYFAIQ